MSVKTKLASVCIGITLPLTALAASPAQPLKVVSSFSILTDLARNVGGDRVAITTLVGPNGDAHVYEPKPADAAAIAKADVVLVNGLQLEGFLPRLVAASGTQAPVVELTQGIEPLPNPEFEDDEHDDHEHDGHHHHHHGKFDPHAWQSVANAEIYVRNIAKAFCAADAAGCATYKKNAAAYETQLQALDAHVKAAIESIPADKRTVITSHDAFNYFDRDYGLQFVAPQGVSTQAEASAADVAALIKQVRADHASAIFIENITNPRLIEQIARETGIEVGGALYSDALSDASGPASTYIDMMRYNVATIKNAMADAAGSQ